MVWDSTAEQVLEEESNASAPTRRVRKTLCHKVDSLLQAKNRLGIACVQLLWLRKVKVNFVYTGAF